MLRLGLSWCGKGSPGRPGAGKADSLLLSTPLSIFSPHPSLHTPLSQCITSYQTSDTAEVSYEAEVFASWLSERGFQTPFFPSQTQILEHFPSSWSFKAGVCSALIWGWEGILMFEATSQDFLFVQSCSPFLHFLHIYNFPPSTSLPSLSFLRMQLGSWPEPALVRIPLNSFKQLPLGSPSLRKSNFLSSCCRLSLST